jgi:hypothetical protein
VSFSLIINSVSITSAMTFFFPCQGSVHVHELLIAHFICRKHSIVQVPLRNLSNKNTSEGDGRRVGLVCTINWLNERKGNYGSVTETCEEMKPVRQSQKIARRQEQTTVTTSTDMITECYKKQ